MVKLPFFILHILSIPVKLLGCGYAALWLLVREYVQRRNTDDIDNNYNNIIVTADEKNWHLRLILL